MKKDNQSKKIERLDNAFLFALSSLGLIISFMQIVMKNLTDIIDAIPFLLVGIMLPFYVGYMHGAIELDSLEERMRGWIYLIIGTTSYFAFFIFGEVHAEYIYKESLFLLIIAFGVLITYSLLKWMKRVLNSNGASEQYAFSGTVLCAVSIAFLIRLMTSLYFDFQGKDIFEMVLTNSSELLFWVSIVLALLSIVIIFEKASRNALQAELELPTYKGKLGKLVNFSLIKGVLLGFMLLEYTFSFNQRACFLWSQAFALWFLGCAFWTVKASFFPQAFLLLTVVLASLATIIFYRMPTISFENIENATTTKSGYALMLFVAAVTMVFSSSVQTGVLLIVLSTSLYILSNIRSLKRK